MSVNSSKFDRELKFTYLWMRELQTVVTRNLCNICSVFRFITPDPKSKHLNTTHHHLQPVSVLLVCYQVTGLAFQLSSRLLFHEEDVFIVSEYWNLDQSLIQLKIVLGDMKPLKFILEKKLQNFLFWLNLVIASGHDRQSETGISLVPRVDHSRLGLSHLKCPYCTLCLWKYLQ